MIKNLVLLLAVSLFVFPIKVQRRHNRLKVSPLLGLTKALAATTVTGTEDQNTVAGRAALARYFYYTVAGSGDTYGLPPGASSYTDMINLLILSATGEVYEDGYETCAEIPTTGSVTGENDYGSEVTVNFSAGTKTMPAYFGTGAGTTFAKRMVVSLGGATQMNAELTCEAGSTVQSGYILYAQPSVTDDAGPGRAVGLTFEIYFQFDSSTNAVYLDFYAVGTDAPAVSMALRFQTADGATFELIQASSLNMNGTQQYQAAAVKGAASGLVRLNLYTTSDLNGNVGSHDLNDISGITNGDASSDFASTECIDMATNTDGGVGCSTISVPSTFTANGTTYRFRLKEVAQMTLSTVADQ